MFCYIYIDMFKFMMEVNASEACEDEKILVERFERQGVLISGMITFILTAKVIWKSNSI